jgi:predicted O-methyltransferase YrrM
MPDTQPPLMQALGARGIVREWVSGAQTLAILEAADRMGWLEQLLLPTRPETLADENWTPARVLGVLDVLDQAAVVSNEREGWQLTPAFAALVTGASGFSLKSVLASADQDLAALQRLDQEQPAALNGQEALILARDAGVESDPVAQMLYRTVYDAMPEVVAVLEEGGPMLDLGIGVGGALLTTAQLYPQLRLVGVEIVPEVAEEARRRRDRLNLTDQVEIRTLDAWQLPEHHVFTVAYWAQSFFPDVSRAQTLAVLRQALTDQGLLVLQEMPSSPTDAVQQAQRGISQRSAAELAQEAQKAGFVLVQQAATALGNLTVMRNQP